ncbi:MAG: phosphate regulon transcriptional regulator PhoB [Rhodospirillaceae bacterium]
MHIKRAASWASECNGGDRASELPRDASHVGRYAHADILLVEDEIEIQELMALYLESAGHTVVKAATVREAEGMLRRALPDLVLLDWMLPDKSGLEWARDLRASPNTRHVPIIIVSARTSEQDKVEALDAGVDDYVAKPFSPREVLSRIAAVLRRRAPQLSDTVVELDGLRLDHVSRVITADGRHLHIGPTEFRMLQFFMTHPERMHSRQQLVAAIWGRDVDVEDRTVDVNIGRLRDTLRPTHHDVLIETVRGGGYRFRTNRRGSQC